MDPSRNQPIPSIPRRNLWDSSARRFEFTSPVNRTGHIRIYKGCRQKRRSSVLEVEADDGALITSKRGNTNGTSTGFADGSCKRTTSLRTSHKRGCRRNHSGPHSALREPQIVSGPDGLSTRTARPDHERTKSGIDGELPSDRAEGGRVVQPAQQRLAGSPTDRPAHSRHPHHANTAAGE